MSPTTTTSTTTMSTTTTTSAATTTAAATTSVAATSTTATVTTGIETWITLVFLRFSYRFCFICNSFDWIMHTQTDAFVNGKKIIRTYEHALLAEKNCESSYNAESSGRRSSDGHRNTGGLRSSLCHTRCPMK